MSDDVPLTPNVLLRAYASGIFPMGDDATGAVHWYAPDPRGILPLDAFHVPNTLARRVERGAFRVTTNRAFDAVIRHCADRTRTWITPRIIDAYTALHDAGFAHSVEAWTDAATAANDSDGEASDGEASDGEASDEAAGPDAVRDDGDVLAGGLYGVALGGAFFGESMFYRVSNASKVALVHLVRQMRAGGFTLLDVQYANPHLEQFGVVEIPRAEYMDRLADALTVDPTWWPDS